MIALPYAKGKHYAVVGLGASGRATRAALQAAGATMELWDDFEKVRAAMQQENAALQLKPPSQWDWGRLEAVIMSPGVPLYFPQTHEAVALAKQHGKPVIGDVEMLYKAQPQAGYIGITGTNGKSTTTTLIAHILKQNEVKSMAGGNLGPAPLALDDMGSDGSYVLEISSYQLDLMQEAKFDVAVLLNITPDHIDHHGSMEHYVAAKRRLFDRQGKKDVAIVGVDDAICDGIAKELCAAKQQCVIPISTKKKLASGIYVLNGMLHNEFALQAEKGDLRGITSLQGEHNWQNAAAAYAACYVRGLTHGQIMAAMGSYPGLAHRMQWLGEVDNVQFVNDSKATNADAAEKALKTYDDIYWIAGGVAKKGGIEPLVPYFRKVRRAYLIGEAADMFARTLRGKIDFIPCGTLEKAFDAAAKDASTFAKATADKANKKNTPTVLLSPACASFDQYVNFEKRGEAFAALFEARKKQGAA